MLTKTFSSSADLLEPFLRVIRFALEDNESARQLVGHFRATALQFFLATAEFFELPLLFFYLFLLALELEQLLLRLLPLRVQMLRGERIVLTQFQHLLNRSKFFCHDKTFSFRRASPPACPRRCCHINESVGEFQIFSPLSSRSL